RTKIARWREVTNAERVRQFRPSGLRRELDNAAGDNSDRRRRDYEAFSEHAAHLTYPALRMLRAADGSTHWGPRLNREHLRQCLVELARRVVLCVLPLVALLPRIAAEGDADRIRAV